MTKRFGGHLARGSSSYGISAVRWYSCGLPQPCVSPSWGVDVRRSTTYETVLGPPCLLPKHSVTGSRCLHIDITSYAMPRALTRAPLLHGPPLPVFYLQSSLPRPPAAIRHMRRPSSPKRDNSHPQKSFKTRPTRGGLSARDSYRTKALSPDRKPANIACLRGGLKPMRRSSAPLELQPFCRLS